MERFRIRYIPKKIWARVADDIGPLREPSTIGRALTEEEKQRLLKTAVMRHAQMKAKRQAIEALALSTKTAGYDTKNDTNAH